MAEFLRWHPEAIDVTDEVPVNGKPWSGGSGLRKFGFHTIEGGADPWTIGWPRDWSQVVSAPHLYANSDRFPDGDWLYQTLPFDVAGYALRDNAGEDDKYVWQIELAGQAVKVPGYPDSFYRMIAALADFFVAEMGVPDAWLNFACAAYGVYSPCRRTQAEMDRFAGFFGHCHFGRGIDKHWDPGRLDVPRVQSFMNGGDTPPEEEDMRVAELGDEGTIVRWIQQLLHDFRSAAAEEIKIDGVYGPITEKWVWSAQKTWDLKEPDGICDGFTLAALVEHSRRAVEKKQQDTMEALQIESRAKDKDLQTQIENKANASEHPHDDVPPHTHDVLPHTHDDYPPHKHPEYVIFNQDNEAIVYLKGPDVST